LGIIPIFLLPWNCYAFGVIKEIVIEEEGEEGIEAAAGGEVPTVGEDEDSAADAGDEEPNEG